MAVLKSEEECDKLQNCSIPDIHPGKCSACIREIWSIFKTVGNILAGILVTSYFVWGETCMLREDGARAKLVSALLMGVALSNILIFLFFPRYKIGGTCKFGYLICCLTYLDSGQNRCLGPADLYSMGPERRPEEYESRVRILQGAILLCSILHFLIGAFGMKILKRYVRPLSIAPTIVLMGLSITNVSEQINGANYQLFFISVLFMTVFYVLTKQPGSQIASKFTKKFHVALMAGMIIWATCAVLSLLGLLCSNSAARTNAFIGVFEYVDHFWIPFPLPFGVPQLKWEAISIVIPAVLASVFDTARSSSYKTPKANEDSSEDGEEVMAALEALSCGICNAFGCALGVSVVKKDEENGRWAEMYASLLLVLAASCGTFCALMSTIPEPIVVALCFVAFFAVLIEGLDCLKYVDVKRQRNVFILGTSLLFALVVPKCLKSELGGKRAFSPSVAVFQTEFVVGGLVSLILDNLVKGEKEEKLQLPNRTERDVKVSQGIMQECEEDDLGCSCLPLLI